jgi:hypothetical protein
LPRRTREETINMPPQLKQYRNRTILVSIPALYEDGKCRTHTLRDADSEGVWLDSKELVDRLLLDREKSIAATKPLVFVPFAQIAGIIFAAPAPRNAPAPKPAETAADAKSAPPEDAAVVKRKPPSKSGAKAAPAEPGAPTTEQSS